MQHTTPQDVSSTTFQPPVLDGSLLLPEILALHAKNSASHPVFRYESTGPGGLSDIDWSRTFMAIEAAKEMFRSRVRIQDVSIRPVVAILASSDTMTFFAVMQGLMRAGYIPFPISPRNSVAIVTHLLRMTNCQHMIASRDGPLQDIAALVTKDLDNLQVIDMPRFDDLYYSDHPPTALPASRLPHSSLDDTAIIFHSSGSTRFPSPIFLTHHLVLQICKFPYSQEIILHNKILALHVLPLFHIFGFTGICMMVSSGLVLGVFPPSDIQIIPTSDSFLSSVRLLNCHIIFTVPSFLEEWSKDSDAISKLQTSTVFFGGGILSKEAGDILQLNKIKLATFYGLTEAGPLSLPHVPPQSIGWDWCKIAPHINLALVPEVENIFRMHIKTSSTLSLAVVNTEINGVKAFDTKDLVICHPSNPEYWKICGRADDLIVHSTGEKTNPVPIESTLLRDEHVAAAVMFGHSKTQTGVIIQPNTEFMFDPINVEQLTKFRNTVWNAVTLANLQAPQHSRIYKEMILVASPSKPFEITSKGTVRRSATLKLYNDEIERLYDLVANLSLLHIPLPVIWDSESTLVLVQSIVSAVLGRSIRDDTDIFEVGGDSLAAISIRNTVINCMRESKTIPLQSLRSLPQNLVFEYPTIAALSTYTHSLVAQSTKSLSGATLDGNSFPHYVGLPSQSELEKTVVKLREGPGVPLIMIHGGEGSFFLYSSYSDNFDTAVWTLQITSETPLTSLHEMAMFYHSKIKEQQPSGPYRFAAYSGTSILGVALAKNFEDSGDTVAQLGFLDHSPLLFVYSANRLGNPNPAVDTNREKIVTAAIGDVAALLQYNNNSIAMAKVCDAWLDASNGLPAPEPSKLGASRFKKYVGFVADFVYALTTDINGVSSLDALVQWVCGLKAPLTVYAAQRGTLVMVDEKDREEWNDLGARYMTGARLIKVSCGHMEMLTDEIVIKDLQRAFKL